MVVIEGFVGDGEYVVFVERFRVEFERKRSKSTRSFESCFSDVILSGEVLIFFDVVLVLGSVNL